MNRHNRSDKPDWVPPRSNRLLDQVRERVRYLHYSLQTEKAYVYWAKAFVLWAARSGGFRHPRDMGQADVEGFLTMLATEKQVSPATHRQALNALLCLYRQVLGMELPWLQQIGRPPECKRIPVVLTMKEVQAVLERFGDRTAPANDTGRSCLTRWSASNRVRERAGRGSGCSRRTSYRWIRKPAWNAAITSMRNG
jgi:hypothetical protein